jgi:hypothetical protein
MTAFIRIQPISDRLDSGTPVFTGFFISQEDISAPVILNQILLVACDTILIGIPDPTETTIYLR